MDGISDIEQLPLVSTEKILTLLADRYGKDDIYTWASTTLVAVNPYKDVDHLYYQETQQEFSTLAQSDAPHIYSIAENSISIIKRDYRGKSDASIIVSGESGAGKTENTKHLLRYLTVVRSEGSTSKRQLYAQEIEQNILAFNPVLESFGNASTSCNDNSSRFGKYILLQYDSDQMIVGAHMQTYLLEKTRIVRQSEGNFNFHIFYQFLEGLSGEEKKKYLAGRSDTCYNYARHPPQTGHKTQTWKDTLKAWQRVNFTTEDQDDICTVLGVILCLGNIEFSQNHSDDLVEVSDLSADFVEKVSSLLGVDSRTLVQTLLYRRISTSHARRKSVFNKPCSLNEATSRRDCIAKLLYDRLFGWLVSKINSKIQCQEYSSFIGLLDIYGFESFSVNSLEQLCINYANERLQHYFVQYYLRDIQAEYAEERVPWQHVSIQSNNETCVQLMSNNPGVFSLLNEECQLNRLVMDDNIAERLSSSLSSHPNLVCTQKDVMMKSFTIKHYAHPVRYHTENLVDKNKDCLPNDVIELLEESNRAFICELIKDCMSTMQGKQNKKTVLSKFKQSLDELLTLLKRTECQYVRCIKPNKQAKPGVFDEQYVDKQLKACGIMETVKIRSQAHAVRMNYDEFLSLYSILHTRQSRLKARDKENAVGLVSTPMTPRQRRRTLLPTTEINQSDQTPLITNSGPTSTSVTPVKSNTKRSVTGLLRHLLGQTMTQSVSFGTTKLFIKSQTTVEMLEAMKMRKLSSSVFIIQCAWRRFLSQQRHSQQNYAAYVITRALRRYREVKVKQRADKERLEAEKLALRLAQRSEQFCNVTVRRSRNSAAHRVSDAEHSSVIDSAETEAALEVQCVHKSVASGGWVERRNLQRKSGVVSIRHISNMKIMFHVRASSLLKYSHLSSDSHLNSCSLLDCLDEQRKSLYVRFHNR